MGKALYREYRSTTFDEVIGQDHITSTLKNSLKSGTIAHAYLLTGPRGVGKTSIARILAYAVNDLSYEKDGNNLDIIEIDAASNRRIDEIRTLRERVHIAPAAAKYKVYIIDEVHMLTREAFNALLKTLEEPPAHAIFILATTDAHKLPDTIVSRCISFTFRPISEQDIVKHLAHIAQQEKLKISTEALEILATHADGSFRDSISLLDQIKNISSDGIEKEDIERALGLAPAGVVEAIMQAVETGDPRTLSDELDKAYEFGSNETNLTRQIAGQLRDGLINRNSVFSSADVTTTLKDLLDVPSSPKPRTTLELCLLNLLFKATPSEPKPRPAPQPVTAEPEPAPKIAPKPPEPKHEAPMPKPEATPQPESEPTPEPEETTPVDTDLWQAFLKSLKGKNNTLYGMVQMADARMDDGKLLIAFKYAFHLKQFGLPKNKAIIISVLRDIKQPGLEIIPDLIIKPQTAATSAPSKANPVAAIDNIFGGSEIIES